MGLMRRLRRSFRSKSHPAAPTAVFVTAPAAKSTTLATTSATRVARSSSPLAKSSAATVKDTLVVRSPARHANTANNQDNAGSDAAGGGDIEAAVGGGGSGSVVGGGGISSTTSTSSGVAASQGTVFPTAEAVGEKVYEPRFTAGDAELRQLTLQVRELWQELASMRAALRTLEEKVSRMMAVPSRRLLRANSCQPATQSLVTSPLALEEGPDCALSDDEFHDALAVSLLSLEAESDKKEELMWKKEAEKKEWLMKKSEEEANRQPEQMKELVCRNWQDNQHEQLSTDSVKSGEKVGSQAQTHDEGGGTEQSRGVQENNDQRSGSAERCAPPKPARSISSSPEPETDNATAVAATNSISQQREPTVAGLQTALPPAAAPRAGCMGDCGQLGHSLAAEIERVVTEQLALVTANISDGWSLFAEQGDMRMYKMAAPADDRSVDPLKALSKARGVTARELCRHYWEPSVRLDWETTVDRVTVLARPDPSTVICHQLHRRIWPAQQRDTVFWSHLCRRRVAGAEWSIVVNHSIDGHSDEPPSPPGTVRAVMTSTLAGRDEQPLDGSRRQLVCNVAYSSHVDPGGWAPTTGLRLVYKREYPRFLQRFTAYVTQKCHDKPLEE